MCVCEVSCVNMQQSLCVWRYKNTNYLPSELFFSFFLTEDTSNYKEQTEPGTMSEIEAAQSIQPVNFQKIEHLLRLKT